MCGVWRGVWRVACLLDIIITNRLAIIQLLAAKDEALLLWRDALLVLRKVRTTINNTADFFLAKKGRETANSVGGMHT